MKVLNVAFGLFCFPLFASTAIDSLAQATPQPGGQAAGTQPAPGQPGPGQDGQRGGRGGGWGGGMGAGRGIFGTVTESAADHYTIRTEAGESYIIHFSANTRIMKQPAGGRGPGGGAARGEGAGGGARAEGAPGGNGSGAGRGEGGGGGYGGNSLETIKPTDIKVGDALAAMGEVDAQAKSVGAIMIMQIDPERAKQMREMQANYGKTWLAGKVTAIDGVKVTLTGSMDNTAHTFLADENTTFRKRRDPITLADIQVGDNVRVDGAEKDGTFLATTVSAMGAQQGQTPSVPRNAPPPPQ